MDEEAMREARSWLAHWERGSETKPEDVKWFAQALETYAAWRVQKALEEATGYSLYLSCCRSAKEHVAHRITSAVQAERMLRAK